MNFLSVVAGTLVYEFRMQVRRRSVWLVLAIVSILIFGLFNLFTANDTSARLSVMYLAMFMAWFIPLCTGLVLADRLARDRKIHVDEILNTFSGPLGARLSGKYLGSTLATLVPVILIYAAGIVFIINRNNNLGILPLALEAFAAILLPSILFTAGLSIGLPAFMKVPIYQIVFVGYWFWSNLLPPRFHVPTLMDTMLNATGPWAFAAFFHFKWLFLNLHLSILQGVESILLITGLGIAAMVMAWGYLRWEQASM